MSSYLLLRNNQESGPFSLEEVTGKSLMPYDLIWVIGKSAAWRYPGEIAEFKSFAPPVPEQITDLRKTKPDQGLPDSQGNKKTDTGNYRIRENVSKKINSSRSVYVNLPAEKKPITQVPPMALGETIQEASATTDGISAWYDEKPSRSVRNTGKLLWTSTIILLFGAGILTGFFISDRRKFFSTANDDKQQEPSRAPFLIQAKKEISPAKESAVQNIPATDLGRKNNDFINQVPGSVVKKINPVSGKKKSKNETAKKDSVVSLAAVRSYLKADDSLKQNSLLKNELLYQKIKAHPESYVNLVTGRFSTGMFGGVSSFPVTVTNNSPVMMDLVVVNIDYIQNNEKVFKTESISFNDLEPGETVTIKAPKSSRGTKIATRIRVVNSRQLDLSYSN
jgi:hypothetical protein